MNKILHTKKQLISYRELYSYPFRNDDEMDTYYLLHSIKYCSVCNEIKNKLIMQKLLIRYLNNMVSIHLLNNQEQSIVIKRSINSILRIKRLERNFRHDMVNTYKQHIGDIPKITTNINKSKNNVEFLDVHDN